MLLHRLPGALILLVCALFNFAAYAQCPATTPVQGAAIRGAAPLFPATNWWNLDISTAPVDPGSANFITFINTGGVKTLHPDFGGEESPGSVNIYGFPYAVVDGSQPKLPVTFDYWDESDGVDMSTQQGIPFYPIPAQAQTQSHWIEGGAAGNVDQRSSADRHLLMIDCTNNTLYELYNVWYNPTQGQWYGGSGAFFDMNTNNRRPDGWTSADAAGLAILPGLVRYDEAWNPAVTDIGHAFRVTVRATNGYVYPASHRAGSTAGALPMGARMRLKAVDGNGLDPALRTSDPNVRKIFRAMQKYGVIVADNGTDMYISGTFDTRWNNDILNPAFSLLSAGDFDVIQLGWNPPSGPAALASISANPSSVVGGNSATGTVSLTSAAPSGGALVTLTSNIAAATVPPSVTVVQGASTANFTINTTSVSSNMVGTLTAVYAGANKATTFTVNVAPPPPPVALSAVAVSPTSVAGGSPATGTVTLTAAAPAGGTTVTLSSSNTSLATVPANVIVGAGTTTGTFTITTKTTKKNANVTITASYSGVNKTATLTVKRR